MTTPSSTTSQKHREFTAEPMRDKPVDDLPGIGSVLAGRLKEQGFTKVNESNFTIHLLMNFIIIHVKSNIFIF